MTPPRTSTSTPSHATMAHPSPPHATPRVPMPHTDHRSTEQAYSGCSGPRKQQHVRPGSAHAVVSLQCDLGVRARACEFSWFITAPLCFSTAPAVRWVRLGIAHAVVSLQCALGVRARSCEFSWFITAPFWFMTAPTVRWVRLGIAHLVVSLQCKIRVGVGVCELLRFITAPLCFSGFTMAPTVRWVRLRSAHLVVSLQCHLRVRARACECCWFITAPLCFSTAPAVRWVRLGIAHAVVSLQCDLRVRARACEFPWFIIAPFWTRSAFQGKRFELGQPFGNWVNLSGSCAHARETNWPHSHERQASQRKRQLKAGYISHADLFPAVSPWLEPCLHNLDRFAVGEGGNVVQCGRGWCVWCCCPHAKEAVPCALKAELRPERPP